MHDQNKINKEQKERTCLKTPEKDIQIRKLIQQELLKIIIHELQHFFIIDFGIIFDSLNKTIQNG